MAQTQVQNVHKRPIQVLSEDEEILVDKTEYLLKEKSMQDYHIVHEKFRRLRTLGNAVLEYPSLKNTQFINDVIIGEHLLPEFLFEFSTSSHLLRTPTKVISLRSFLVAKLHAFSLLSKLVQGNDELYKLARNAAFSVVFTLMAEIVYFSCLEDPIFSGNAKTKLAEDLINLWDSGTDPRSIQHLTALSSLWTARDSAPPSFGTMDGNTELFRISINMDSGTEWEDFLKQESTNDETRWALEEFLFGLSYEEILQVRNRLNRYGVTAVNYDEVRSYLDSKPAYSLVDNSDSWTMISFYTERRDACALRKRVSAPGPLRTLEEIYLRYRIILEAY